MATANENRIQNYVDRGKEAVEGAREQVTQTYHDTQQMVRDYPISAALTVFGAGIGVGMLVTFAMLPSRRRSWYDSYANSDMAKQFADAVSRFVPESVSKRFQ